MFVCHSLCTLVSISRVYEAYVSKIVYYTGPFVPAFHCLIDGSFFYIKMFSGCDHLHKEFNGVGMIQSFLVGVLIRPVDKWMLELWQVMVLLQWMHVHISILNTSLISGIYNVEGNLQDVNWFNFFCEIFLFLVVYIAEVAVNSVSSNYIPLCFVCQ